MKKRIVALLLGTCMVATMLVGCGGGSASTNTDKNSEQNTESHTQQSTEFDSEETDEPFMGLYNPDNITVKWSNDKEMRLYHAFECYVREAIPGGPNVNTGGQSSSITYPSFMDFMKSDKASDLIEEFREMNAMYDSFPAYYNGDVSAYVVAAVISEDGGDYKPIYNGDKYVSTENTKLVVYYKVVLTSTISDDPTYAPYTADVIVVLAKDSTTKDNGAWWILDDMLNEEHLAEYFPDLNLE